MTRKTARPTEWSDPDKFKRNWDKRAEAVRDWLPDTGIVADIGCGPHQALRGLLAPGVGYQPADLTGWTPEVAVIDLDQGQFPEGDFSASTLLGVLEYLEKPGLALRAARKRSGRLILSYVHPKGEDFAPVREKRHWINAFKPHVLTRLLARQGWQIAEQRIFGETDHGIQMLYLCTPCAPVKPPALGPLASRVREEGLTYLRPEKMARLETVLTGMATVPEGDFVEFGLALGGSGIVIAHAAQAQGRRFLGFDVFGQIPAPSSEHDDPLSRARYREIAEGKSSGIRGALYYGYRDDLLGEVTDSFARFGLPVDGDRVQLHKGLFQDTWPALPPAPVAFAHVDCDWYDPVAFCLTALARVLVPGGAILLDDYHDYGGARLAVDQFVAAHPDYRMEDGDNVILWRGQPG